ncbi:MAG: hypothetical protein ACK5KV_06810 [Bacteroides graminisolvens]|uniref:hypothetical protein n=1 Tax=Bacteroides graminisolvens TaxID=477666 RepID=UPI003A846074
MDFIYGIAAVKFGGKTLGYIDQNGFQPAGTAPTRTPIYAAQVKSGPVLTLTSNPGQTAFNITLIELNSEGLTDVIGGTKDANGNWEPPEKGEKTGVMDIVTDSGHTLRFYKAHLSWSDFANGLNNQNVLGIQFRVEVEKDADGKTWKKFQPGIDPATGSPVVEG